MSVTNEQFEAAFINATPVQKYLCTNTGNKLTELAEKYDLAGSETYSRLVILIGDIILGFYKTEDTITLLQKELSIQPQTAMLLGNDIQKLLAPLHDQNWQPSIIKESLLSKETLTNKASKVISVSTEIAEAEAMLNALPPIPTVRTNSNPVPPTPADMIYTTTQSAILGEGRMRSVATPVNRPAAAQPQWDSAA